MRIKPSAWAGIAIWLVYVAIIVVMQKSSGIPYTDFGDTAANMWRGIIPSLVVGSLVTALLGVWMGWWGAALRDKHRTKVGWALIAPVIYLLIALVTTATSDWGNISVSFLIVAVVLGIGVGFAEEFVCRGMLLVGLRGNMQEIAVWALTCLLFGAMHGANIFLGQAAGPTMFQIAMAAIQGSGFYILRRYYGSLVWAMVLHGFWDFSIFVHEASGAAASIANVFVWVAAPFALVGGFVVARRTQQGPVEDYAVGPKASGSVVSGASPA